MQLDEAQTKAVAKAQSERCGNVFIAWMKMGTGKTRVALAIFEQSGFSSCVVVTRRIAFDAWVDEINECQLDYLVYEESYKVENILRLTKPGRKKVLLISAGDLKKFPATFDKTDTMLIVDELYLFGNPKSKRSKLLQQESICFPSRIGLSGTLMPAQDNITIWGQVKALQAHRILARNETDFRSKFQNALKTAFGRKHINKEGSVEEIKQILEPLTFVYFPEGRPTRTQIVSVRKNPQQLKAVKTLQEIYELNDWEYEHAMQIVHAVNGISNGWWEHPETGVVEIYTSPKIEMLLSLIMEIISAGESVVVWCAYHNDIAAIKYHLDLPFLVYTSLDKFDVATWNKGKVKIVLATEQMGGAVNYFKHVQYAIYFSISYKLLDLQQSMGRHERKGSNHDGAHYYFLQTKGTYDARIYSMVTQSDLSEKEMILALAKNLNEL